MTTCREIFTFSWPLRGREEGGGQPERSAWPLSSSFFLTPSHTNFINYQSSKRFPSLWAHFLQSGLRRHPQESQRSVSISPWEGFLVGFGWHGKPPQALQVLQNIISSNRTSLHHEAQVQSQQHVAWIWLILIDAYCCWLILIDSDWCWLMLIDWFWLILIVADWCWLMRIDADSDWC